MFQTSSANWITDPRTLKQYLVLDTYTLSHDDLQHICDTHGGFLPEPRGEADNQFLNSLATDSFFLGMTDTADEGQWVWDSDGSPVTWTNWIFEEPNGGRGENCVMMFRQFMSDSNGHRTDGWNDLPCQSNENRGSLICERSLGSYTHLT